MAELVAMEDEAAMQGCLGTLRFTSKKPMWTCWLVSTRQTYRRRRGAKEALMGWEVQVGLEEEGASHLKSKSALGMPMDPTAMTLCLLLVDRRVPTEELVLTV